MLLQELSRTINELSIAFTSVIKNDAFVICRYWCCLWLLCRVKWVTLYGTKYQPGMIVVEGHDGLMPTFAQIKSLLALPDKRVFFLCKRVNVLRFVQHLWAFEVIVINTECVLDYNSLYDHHPLDLYSIMYDQASRTFVRPKYHIHE